MKKTTSLLLVLVLSIGMLLSVAGTAQAGSTWYNASANGGKLNVREFPSTVDSPVLGRIDYGAKVSVRMTMASGWACIDWNGDVGYVMTRFLSKKKPGPKPTAKPQDDRSAEEQKLHNELKSLRDVSDPYYVAVVATRTSGQINLRTGPSKTTRRVASLRDGRELIVVGETTNWYRVQVPETQQVGYVFKQYTRILNKPVSFTETDSGVERLGTLSVNGKFDLTCKLPETYKMQVINIRGNYIEAVLLSEDITKPDLDLTISFDETYSDVERMNDLTDEQLKILEATFTDVGDVEISYSQTGYGTKLLISKENDGDGATQFVEILAIYKGYFIEFDVKPNAKAADASLSDDQIRMCIDFLTDVDFTEIK